MRPLKTTVWPLLVVLSTLTLSIVAFPAVHAPSTGGNQYTLNAVPAFSQEGATISLVLQVSIGLPSGTSTTYSFRFNVLDPSGTTVSRIVNQTVPANQNEFTVVVAYPSPTFAGSNSLVGKYGASVDQMFPSPMLSVGTTSFILSITDSSSYERTQTVNIQAGGYLDSESVDVTIQTKTTLTIVNVQTVTATPGGVVVASWKIPPNATIDNYLVYLNGTSTTKTPSDTQTISIRAATMSIASLSSTKATYQRTETMKFTFQPKYPDGSVPSTGVGLLTLTGPNAANPLTLTATYDSVSQTFGATYPTSVSNQTGTWTANIGSHGYSDAYGNTGPGTTLTTSPQLTAATLSVSVTANTNVAVGQQLRLNVTATYPDGSSAQSATVRAYLVYTGSPAINDTVPVVYDSTLGLWVGTHTVSSGDTGGLWSLIVSVSDSSNPADTGQATRAITIQNTTSPVTPTSAFPLFYFGILAAIIAAILLAALMVFRKKRVGHASLKIDLEAVHSEAGRIESQEFFQTIKEQVRKDLEEKK
ncbi:hypothetical protein J2P12_04675 [Candidatus Bathyarchaeota archaeon]|nr:hypothetical protein [Candidatus Bathyarchaeota archaeon]